jgi:hypothetical protein
MKIKTIYSFFTTNGWRTGDIKAYNPKQAYKLAKAQKLADMYGEVITSYIKYDKDGSSPLDRVYTLNR